MTGEELDQAIARLLRSGATHAVISAELGVGDCRIRRVRREHGIELPPGRAKRTRTELDALEPKAVAMLLAGAKVWDIYRETRLGLDVIARLRREAGLPVVRHDWNAGVRRTVDQMFAHHAKPTAEGGHLLWTGPKSGRSLDLIAAGRKHNARAVAFEKHYGRAPEGRLRRTCQNPTCIAGAHHTDRTIRTERKDKHRAH